MVKSQSRHSPCLHWAYRGKKEADAHQIVTLEAFCYSPRCVLWRKAREEKPRGFLGRGVWRMRSRWIEGRRCSRQRGSNCRRTQGNREHECGQKASGAGPKRWGPGGVAGSCSDHWGLALHHGLNPHGFNQSGSTEGFWLSTQCVPISLSSQDLVQTKGMTLSVPCT